MRERKDKVNMPVVGKGLPTRVEKARKQDIDINFEKDGFKGSYEKAKQKHELKKQAKQAKEKQPKQEKPKK